MHLIREAWQLQFNDLERWRSIKAQTIISMTKNDLAAVVILPHIIKDVHSLHHKGLITTKQLIGVCWKGVTRLQKLKVSDTSSSCCYQLWGTRVFCPVELHRDAVHAAIAGLGFSFVSSNCFNCYFHVVSSVCGWWCHVWVWLGWCNW